MKNMIFFLFLAIMTGCAADRDAYVAGNVNNIEDGTVILLSRFDEQGEVVEVISNTISGNSFAFNLGILEQPERVELTVAGSSVPGSMILWAVPGNEVKTTGSGLWPGSWTAPAMAAGHEQWNEYHLPTAGLLEEQGKILYLLEEIFAEGIPTLEQREIRDNKVVALYDALDSLKMEISFVELGIMKSRQEVSPLDIQKLKNASLNSYYGEYSNPTRAIRLREAATEEYFRIEEIFKTYPEYEFITARLFPKERIMVGDFFEDTRFYDYEGRADHIANYAGNGKYVLIDCWFSNCSPCREIIPVINDIKEKFRDEIFVVGFNYIDNKEEWLTGSDQYGVGGINLWRPGGRDGFCEKYGFMANPVLAMISPEGKLIEVFGTRPNYDYLMQTVGSFLDPGIERPTPVRSRWM